MSTPTVPSTVVVPVTVPVPGTIAPMPIVNFELLDPPERQRYESLAPFVIWLDAAMLLELHQIFPKLATWDQISRSEGFRFAINGVLFIFATTPTEEMVVDDYKNQGSKTDWGPWNQASSGVGMVSEFDQMRLAEYLVQKFAINRSDIDGFAIESTDDDFEVENKGVGRSSMPSCPPADQARNAFRLDAFIQCATIMSASTPVHANIYYFRGRRLARHVNSLQGAHGLDGRVVLGRDCAQLTQDIDTAFATMTQALPTEPVPHIGTSASDFFYPPLGYAQSLGNPRRVPPAGWRVQLPLSSTPKYSMPLSFTLKPGYILRIILDTNVSSRCWQQIVDFFNHFHGPGMVASVPEVERELCKGTNLIKVQQRKQDLSKFRQQTQTDLYTAQQLSVGPTTMIHADGPPRVEPLTGDLLIRAQTVKVCERLATSNPIDEIICVFLTHDGGARRIMLATPKMERVHFLVPFLINDRTGWSIQDILYSALNKFWV